MFALLLATSLTVAPVEVPVAFSQRGTLQWGVIATANGVVSQLSKKTLDVSLSEFTLKGSSSPERERTLYSVKLCTGKPVKKTWEVVTCSVEQPLQITIKPGESIIRQNMTFALPVPKRAKIASFFLTLAIEGRTNDGREIMYYTDSEGDPLQTLQDLQVRPSQRR